MIVGRKATSKENWGISLRQGGNDGLARVPPSRGGVEAKRRNDGSGRDKRVPPDECRGALAD